jgi:hypothetical protein
MNHFAHGEFHSRTFFHGLNQCRSLAALAQKACGFLRAVLNTAALLMLADFLNSLGGGKFLFSFNKTSIALSAMVQPPSKKFAADQENVSDSIEALSAWQEGNPE